MGGHVEFLNQAKAFGDYLIVCIPSDDSLFMHKRRRPFIPVEHKRYLLDSMEMVDEVVIGSDQELGTNFRTEFLKAQPHILVVTEDDKFEKEKRLLCSKINTKYIKVPKITNLCDISSTNIIKRIKSPDKVPVRVDFAGGWLDVPQFAKKIAML